jgi:hypothetical protein
MTIRQEIKRKCTLQLCAKGVFLQGLFARDDRVGDIKQKCRSRNMKPCQSQETFQFRGERGHSKPFLSSPDIEDFEFLVCAF